ncbi:MAG: TRAP transporter large permease subunit [Chloroflexi bacterium]|nr:TRAP transporter large permease subunit [Chloroflexota bacterium]
MEWWLAALILLSSLLILLFLGMPVAFAFMFINVVGVIVFWSGEAGLSQLIQSMWSSISSFTLVPIPMFILMGEVMFRSGIAPRMMDTLDKWLGRLPGRLGLLAVGGGTVFATLSGSAMASTAMLGSVLTPELEKRGYQKSMSLGPILGSAGLAIMIPPTNLGVLLAVLADISVGAFLLAIIIPGLLMAALYATYIIVRCQLQPQIAPPYDVPRVPLSDRIVSALRYILPLSTIIFLVLGLIFLGVATPSEAAAMGAIGCFVLAFIYQGLDWKMVKESVAETVSISGMVLLILTGATAFSQILAFSGATRGIVEVVSGLQISPLLILIAMQLTMLVMGMFIDQISIMMITLPIYMPIINAVGINPVWFGAIMLLNMEMATTSPPFGFSLFVMKGVAPPNTTMGDIYKAALPFLGCDLIAMILMISFPPIVLWLPTLMRAPGT